mmetsp:Transcript_7198/g.21191  ORF Transcript_7198/g.21191 Transcript_7198/m.21191 type:complete len:281 (-) Transcript_7198:5536-6378(-)
MRVLNSLDSATCTSGGACSHPISSVSRGKNSSRCSRKASSEKVLRARRVATTRGASALNSSLLLASASGTPLASVKAGGWSGPSSGLIFWKRDRLAVHSSTSRPSASATTSGLRCWEALSAAGWSAVGEAPIMVSRTDRYACEASDSSLNSGGSPTARSSGTWSSACAKARARRSAMSSSTASAWSDTRRSASSMLDREGAGMVAPCRAWISPHACTSSSCTAARTRTSPRRRAPTPCSRDDREVPPSPEWAAAPSSGAAVISPGPASSDWRLGVTTSAT